MSSYRFCRTDDIQLLVDAWNACGLPQERGATPLTVPAFKREIRELGLWCSSCMVAFDGSAPVAVLIGCKRPPQTLVLRIAVHPDHQRQGHGRHLLSSLSAKLAILGPKELVAEVPAGNAAAIALFEACGWRESFRTYDLVYDPESGAVAPSGLVQAATPDELGEAMLPPPEASRSWARTRDTLRARAERLQGALIASGDRVDASVLYTEEESGGAAVWAVAYERDSAGENALRTILRDLARRLLSVRLPRTAGDEIDFDRLGSLGLVKRDETIHLASEATRA